MKKYMDRWMLLMVGLLMAACGSDEGNGDNGNTAANCFLDICVNAPVRPTLTRSDVGEIAPVSDAESTVKTLQIWVFKSSDGTNAKALSYLNATPTFLNESPGSETYKMEVSSTFANNPENVDVYVVANAASCGLSFDETTERDQLDKAQIGTSYFGTNTLTAAVPGDGLPMSAVLRNQQIINSFPTLRIGTTSGVSTLQLTRAVSKLRFVLCQKANQADSKKLVSINHITLKKDQIPTKSWLFPKETNGYTYQHDAIDYGSFEAKDIPEVEDPQVYAYETQDAQEYEDMINQMVDEHKLLQIGPTYLRESDIRLTGTINFTYNTGTQDVTDEVEFSMAAEGDFLRNHSWIVYIYYLDAKIYTLTVTHVGMKSWTPDNRDENPTFYNW